MDCPLISFIKSVNILLLKIAAINTFGFGVICDWHLEEEAIVWCSIGVTIFVCAACMIIPYLYVGVCVALDQVSGPM